MTESVNIHEAKTHLSRLVDQAAKGQPFVIAKAGKPLVRVEALAEAGPRRHLGFLAGKGVVERDVKSGFGDEVTALFEAGRQT